MIHDLKERGIFNFLRSYLASDHNDDLASLRKLLLGLGIIPVCPYANHTDGIPLTNSLNIFENLQYPTSPYSHLPKPPYLVSSDAAPNYLNTTLSSTPYTYFVLRRG